MLASTQVETDTHQRITMHRPILMQMKNDKNQNINNFQITKAINGSTAPTVKTQSYHVQVCCNPILKL